MWVKRSCFEFCNLTTCTYDYAQQHSKVVLHYICFRRVTYIKLRLSCCVHLSHDQQSKMGLRHVQEEVVRLSAQRMEEEARVTELEDVLNSNLLKRRQELTQRLEQADVEADR